MTSKWLAIAAALTLAPTSALAAPQAQSPSKPGTSSAAAPSSSSKSSSSASAKKTSSKKKRRSRREPTQKAPTPERITEIQSALARNGYYTGNPNGKWDANTVAAMQKFQSSNGLDASGKLDALSLQKLGLGSSVAGVSAPKPVTPPSPAGSAPPAHTVPSQSSPAPNPAPTSSARATDPPAASSSSPSSSAPPPSTPPKR